MKTNTVPSLKCKGNGLTTGFTDASSNGGLIGTNQGYGVFLSTAVYGKNTGTAHGSYWAVSQKSLGIVSDSSKSGIITDTGSMSSITSMAIIKY